MRQDRSHCLCICGIVLAIEILRSSVSGSLSEYRLGSLWTDQTEHSISIQEDAHEGRRKGLESTKMISTHITGTSTIGLVVCHYQMTHQESREAGKEV